MASGNVGKTETALYQSLILGKVEQHFVHNGIITPNSCGVKWKNRVKRRKNLVYLLKILPKSVQKRPFLQSLSCGRLNFFRAKRNGDSFRYICATNISYGISVYHTRSVCHTHPKVRISFIYCFVICDTAVSHDGNGFTEISRFGFYDAHSEILDTGKHFAYLALQLFGITAVIGGNTDRFHA